MPEPERRRRRVRPSSSAAAAPTTPPTDDETTFPPGSSDDAVEGRTARLDPPGVPTPNMIAPTGPPSATATTAAAEPGGEAVPAERSPRPTFSRKPAGPPPHANGAAPDDREAERGLRGLVGSGSSQVSVGAALRARDAARPTEDHLAAADRDLPIIRRNWIPREDLPRNR